MDRYWQVKATLNHDEIPPFIIDRQGLNIETIIELTDHARQIIDPYAILNPRPVIELTPMDQQITDGFRGVVVKAANR